MTNTISDRLSQLSPAKRALLQKLMLEQSAKTVQAPGILRRLEHANPPLSFGQQRLWFLNQLSPGTAAYNITVAVRFVGALDVAALDRSFNETVRRHEALRTTFIDLEGEPLQRIAPALEIPLTLVDLRELPADARRQAADERAFAETQRPFDLVAGPLMRTTLLRLAADEHILVLTMHHIISDGWSFGVLLQELTALYAAFSAGKPSPLADLPIQYADYAVWQRGWLQGEVLEGQLAYWRKHLDNLPDLEIPTDRPYPDTPMLSGATHTFELSRSLTDALNALSQKEGATLFMTLLTAFQTLLARYTGQSDIVIGSAIANRTQAEIEGLIGFFVNTFVLRTDLGGDPTFREALARVREVTLGAYAHQDLPFEQLVNELQPERSLNRNPLFQVGFALQNTPLPTINAAGLTIEPSEVNSGVAKHDLGFILTETADGLTGVLEYATELFDHATIARLGEHFRAILEQIALNPELRLSAIPMLGVAEQRQVVADWNQTDAAYASDLGLHELIEAQAARTPAAIAVAFADQTLSYGELNQRANQLARHLQGLGAGPETRVGIVLERSLEMIVGVLGILKAGGAYVPLDPAYPAGRLAFMLADSQVSYVLTQRHLAPTLPDDRAEIVCLDAEWPRIAEQPDHNLAVTISPDQLAYLIYTSGSTGMPKGVMVTHRSLVNIQAAWEQAYQLGARATAHLQMASFSFDVFAGDLIRALGSGAKLVLCPRDFLLEPAKLYQLMREQAVDSAEFVPAVLRNLLDYLEETGQTLEFMRVLVAGSDRWYGKDAAQIMRLCGPQTTLINSYGVSEATIDSAYWMVDQAKLHGESTIPIGRPFANVRLYVLDASLQPVPIGVPGELCIGGLGLARGYVNHPGLTAERFIPDAFATAEDSRPGARLYRTGDRVRYLPDGALEFLGRTDHQVKLRGFRIELPEIEAVLGQHPAVREAAVTIREDTPASQRLVAYFTQQARHDEENPADAALSANQVDQWRIVFEEFYKEANPSEYKPMFNLAGWDSSYTGLPLTDDEVAEWTEHTVERILALKPQRVLDLGCGSGLIMFRVAPHCAYYCATDQSEAPLKYLANQLQAFPIPSTVELIQRAAGDFTGVEENSFDTVVIGSVVQYFPNIEYLLGVIEGAAKAVRPGGSIFIADVRSLPLLEAYQASVQLYRADDGTDCDDIRQRVQKLIDTEKQLVVDPDFFNALRRQVPKIGWAEIQLRRGKLQNELTNFRYDIVLHVGEPAQVVDQYRQIDWQGQALTQEGLQDLLAIEQPGQLYLAGVPNARILKDVRALALLNSEECPATAGQVRAAVESAADGAIDPEYFWSLAAEFPYAATINWSADRADGSYDVWLVKQADQDGRAARRLVPAAFIKADGVQPWRSYANNPLQQTAVQQLASELRGFLAEKLPEYMLPAAFVALDAFPLTPNGKLDRRALPAPDLLGGAEAVFVAPQTATEELLADLWQALLGVPQVGRGDNFFALGGHSLLATQLIARIRSVFACELPLRALFEAPTLATLASALDAARLQNAAHGAPVAAPALVPQERPAQIPLAFAQQRLWFLNQLAPDSALYSLPGAVRLSGPLAVEALVASLNGVVARHEVLRTSFALVSGQPVQVIQPSLTIPLPLIDFAHLPAAQRDAAVAQQLAQAAAAPFDLAQPPLLRACLLRCGPTEHILFVTMHHSVSDGWSIGIFISEVLALYRQQLDRQAPALPPLPIQYADYALWQRAWLQGPALQTQLAYWQTQLAGLDVLALPTDYPRPAVQSFAGGTYAFQLDGRLVAAVQALSQQAGVTPFMTLLAGFQLLLARYSGQERLAVGTPIAGRARRETEGLIGFFVNTLVLRTDMGGDPTFLDLLGRVRQVCLDAYAHQDVPFERLVEALQPERSLSYNPLFQVMFSLQNAPLPALDLPDLAVDLIELESGSVPFDLALNLEPHGDGLRGTLEYSSALYQPATVARIAEHYQALLAQAVADPRSPVTGLELLSTAERDQLRAWQGGELAVAPETRLHRLVAAHAARQPLADAVICGADHLSYGELVHRANQLAWYLQRQGVGPNVRVGVALERSLDLVVAMLGVLAAGGVFVPLDPAYPSERLAFMLADAQAALVLTTDAVAPRLPLEAARLIRLDALDAELAGQPATAPPDQTVATDLAYIIYTSGSTGTPKGVLVEQRNLANVLHVSQQTFGFTSSDTMPCVAPFSFDIFIFELWNPILAGGTSLLLTHEQIIDIPQLLHDLRRMTVIHTVPSLMRQIINGMKDRGMQPGAYPAMRLMFTGGDAVPPALLADMKTFFPAAEIHVLYGPTEATIICSSYRVPDDQRFDRHMIGKPLANAALWLYDQQQHPVPIGIPGEIYIGGAGVARGYFNRPELTEEKFVTINGQRMYRTGDLGRYLADGSLEFLGRIDQQVKVRGFRIELGEIESALSQHPAIREALVITREETPGDLRLIAYLVVEQALSHGELRGFLAEKLPEYMLPAAFVALDAFPLTPNGKLDRRALPAPDTARPALADSYVAPRTPTEQTLADEWARLLGLERVGVEDNFFELGGHSLLATQIISSVRDMFQVDVPLRHLFEEPTVATLARHIEAVKWAAEDHSAAAFAADEDYEEGEL